MAREQPDSNPPSRKTTFLSYAFGNGHESFVQSVSYYLNSQPGVEAYCYEDQRQLEWRDPIANAITSCDLFVFFVEGTPGLTQKKEFDVAEKTDRQIVRIELGETEPDLYTAGTPLEFHDYREADPERCARAIVQQLGLPWAFADGIPDGYPFDYEKDIIEAYAAREDLSRERLEAGCPRAWPVVRRTKGRVENSIPIETVGRFRPESAEVTVDARPKDRIEERLLTFPEAGPRKRLLFPKPQQQRLCAAIVVSGGIAPGINAVIEGIVSRHELYKKRRRYQLEIKGYMEGLRGPLYGNVWGNQVTLDLLEESERRRLKNAVNQGGSILSTARVDKMLRVNSTASERERMLDDILNRLAAENVNILYMIGGDGTMRAAHSIWRKARDRGYELSVAAVPKTMDNDVLWVWQSFGFLSAVEKAKDMTLQLHTEVSSNPRLGVMQLFGSDSGFVVSHAALGSDVCDFALIPEVPFTMKTVCEHLRQKLASRLEEEEKAYGLIAMAETAIPRDAADFLDCLSDDEELAVREFLRKGRRVYGQTPDELRRASVKIVASALESEFARQGGYWKEFRVVTNEPRHLIRSMTPSVSDVIFGERLGALAVDSAMAGYSDFMISQWLTEYVLVPLDLVVLGRKRVPRDGIFWKTVVAATEQPEELVSQQDHWEGWWEQAERELRYAELATKKQDHNWAAVAAHDAAECAVKALCAWRQQEMGERRVLTLLRGLSDQVSTDDELP